MALMSRCWHRDRRNLATWRHHYAAFVSRSVIYTDIDGTLVGPGGDLLLNFQHEISTAALSALARARSAGISIVGLSGRDRFRMQELGRALGFRGWICELGAISVFDNNIVTNFGEYAGTGNPADELKEAIAPLTQEFAGRLEEHTPWNTNREASILMHGDVPITEINDVLSNLGFGWAQCVENGIVRREVPTLPDLQQILVYHLVPRGVTKRAAIAAHQKHSDIKASEGIVIGDSVSDFECHNEVAHCFLVANGVANHSELQDAVKTVNNVSVTKSSAGEGFAEAVNAWFDEIRV